MKKLSRAARMKKAQEKIRQEMAKKPFSIVDMRRHLVKLRNITEEMIEAVDDMHEYDRWVIETAHLRRQERVRKRPNRRKAKSIKS